MDFYEEELFFKLAEDELSESEEEASFLEKEKNPQKFAKRVLKAQRKNSSKRKPRITTRNSAKTRSFYKRLYHKIMRRKLGSFLNEQLLEDIA